MADKKQAAKEKGESQNRLYKAEGGKIVRLRKNCPKCGAGYFLAEHSNRSTCGHCHYTEFKKK